jgi:hypothetical protein
LWRLLYEGGFIKRKQEANHGDPVWYVLGPANEQKPFTWVDWGHCEARTKDRSPDEGETRSEGGDMIPRVTRAPMLCEPSTRPHEAPDCSCRACVVADVGADMLAFLERFTPYEPKWAPALRQAHKDIERANAEFEAKWGPLLEQMGREAARWPDRMLASLLREEKAKERVVHRELPEAVLASARPREQPAAIGRTEPLHEQVVGHMGATETKVTWPCGHFVVYPADEKASATCTICPWTSAPSDEQRTRMGWPIRSQPQGELGVIIGVPGFKAGTTVRYNCGHEMTFVEGVPAYPACPVCRDMWSSR